MGKGVGSPLRYPEEGLMPVRRGRCPADVADARPTAGGREADLPRPGGPLPA